MFLPKLMFSVKQDIGREFCTKCGITGAHTGKAHTDTAPIPGDAIGSEEVNACRLQC